jgi:hypothetical protein
MRAPDEVADLIERVRVRSAGGGGDELIGEHGSPFREPASQAVGSGKTTALPLKGACAESQFRGGSGLPRTDRPRFAGTPARLIRRVFVFLGLGRLRVSAESSALKRGRRLAISIRVNAGERDRPAACTPPSNSARQFAW